ncbi:MAG: histidine ammonia-lyase [bacterium]
MNALTLDGYSLTIPDFVSFAMQKNCNVVISDSACKAMQASRDIIDEWVESGEIIYGITTGFGEFSNVMIPKEHIEILQENLIISHSAGIGKYLDRHIVRGMMILRINALAKGCSGIRLSTVETLIEMIRQDLIPAVPSQGSVGSSGDLAPLSHIALALIGKGTLLNEDGTCSPSGEIMLRHGIQPVRLQAKEGLALINGTQMMTALGAFAVHRAKNLANIADIAGAISVDALRGTDTAFDERIHQMRGFSGQLLVAKRLRKLLQGSGIRASHKVGDGLVQDAYSLRCMPQIHGASRDAIAYVEQVISTELNSANDNPLIFSDGKEHLEGGNFHGQPIALALDFLAIACAELGNVSERRTERMVNGALSNGLPRFLAHDGGVQSGMMIAQYTAAALVSENKVLSHPASVDSIPTSANQEDHNSMGSISARKVHTILDHLEHILAVELLCGIRGIEFHQPLKTSEILAQVHAHVRNNIPSTKNDSIIHEEIKAMTDIVSSGDLLAIAEPLLHISA